jgi:hypothetical protein
MFCMAGRTSLVSRVTSFWSILCGSIDIVSYDLRIVKWYKPRAFPFSIFPTRSPSEKKFSGDTPDPG